MIPLCYVILYHINILYIYYILYYFLFLLEQPSTAYGSEEHRSVADKGLVYLALEGSSNEEDFPTGAEGGSGINLMAVM